MAHSGKYKPRYPEKYRGDVENIVFRSSWELKFFRDCDLNPNVIEWASEEIAIPYKKPGSKKPGGIHKYYPDVYMLVQNREGDLTRYLIEIKPHKEAALSSKSSLYDKLAIVINEAKWKAAVSFCDKYGFVFKVVTEKTMFKA